MAAARPPRLLRSLFALPQTERRPLLWALAYFFCLLCSYYILRPLRDEMGIQGGVHNLPWLFSATLVAMLCAVPLYGWLAARLPRRRMLPTVYLFFIANLALFFFVLHAGFAPQWAARAFFVWVSVFNLFVVSVFWSFMVDLFSAEQGKRLFGFIAAGGSAGALAGPALTAALAAPLGTANMLLVSAGFLALTLLCIHRLLRWRRAHPSASAYAAGIEAAETPIGGSIWAGVTHVLRSSYLLGIGAYMLLYTTLSTFLYFQQARIVADTLGDPAQRTSLFAAMDLAVNSLSLLAQLFMTSALLRRFGLVVALAVLPIATALGYAALGFAPILAVVVAFQVLRRALDFALARPARELLYTAVAREEKYKAKSFIDTTVYRSGDAASGWLFAALTAAGLGLAAIAWLSIPLAALWLALSVWLGRRQHVLGTADKLRVVDGGSDE